MQILKSSITHLTALLLGILCMSTAAVALASWSGPPANPPQNNVDAPVHVGTADQVKSGGLGVDSLVVYGNALIEGATRYLNFGSTAGETGYGMRNNGGTIEIKHFDGNWVPFPVCTDAGSTITWNGSQWECNAIPQPDCPNVGDVCLDGTVYGGVTREGKVYTTPVDAGVMTLTQARSYCSSLTEHGQTDWTLPDARYFGNSTVRIPDDHDYPLYVLWKGREAIGGFVDPGGYWVYQTGNTTGHRYTSNSVNWANGWVGFPRTHGSHSWRQWPTRCVRFGYNAGGLEAE